MTAHPSNAEQDARPHAIAAERAVLGACLLTGDAIGEVSRLLTADDFYRPAHGLVYSVLVDQWETGYPTDEVSIGWALDRQGLLLRAGGLEFLHTLVAETPTAVNAAYWAEIVAERSARARLIEATVRVQQLVRHDDHDIGEVLDRSREIIEAATRRERDNAGAGTWLEDFVAGHVASWDEPDPTGIPVPYVDLEDVIGTPRGGQMLVVAGRPGAGKSVIASDWAVYVAARGMSVLFASLEMTRGSLVNRMIAARSSVRISAIEQRTLRADDEARARAAADDIAKLPVHILDKYTTTLARIRTYARELRRGDRGLDFLIVDYVQLLTGDSSLSEREIISQASRDLKLLATELDIPVLVVAQLNRGPEGRQDKVPLLSELKGSGSLEQDPDIVMMVHRPDSYDRESPRAGEADLVVPKNRNGPLATVTVAHQLHFSRFVDLAQGYR